MDDQSLERAYREGARWLERYGTLPAWRELPQGAKDALGAVIEGGREELRTDIREALSEAIADATDLIVDAVVDEVEDEVEDEVDETKIRQAVTRILEGVGKAVDDVR